MSPSIVGAYLCINSGGLYLFVAIITIKVYQYALVHDVTNFTYI